MGKLIAVLIAVVLLSAGCGSTAAPKNGTGTRVPTISATASAPTDPRVLTLRLAELPTGFTVSSENYQSPSTQHAVAVAHGAVRSYARAFTRRQISGLLELDATVISFKTASGASWAISFLLRQVATSSHSHVTMVPMSAPNFGDQSAALAISGKKRKVSVTGEAIIIRVHRYVAEVLGVGLAGLNDVQQIIPIVRLQVQLLQRGK